MDVTNRRKSHPSGKSLIEVLCVLSIVSLLVQLTLPALQAARESARRTQCAHHLRQLGLATLTHEQAKGFFPSGGWHFHWIGEPERGTGPDQPGSWAYNLLDYLGESELRRMGQGLSGTSRYEALQRRCRQPLGIFHCPSRRAPTAYPHRENRRPFTQGGPTSTGACLGRQNGLRSQRR